MADKTVIIRLDVQEAGAQAQIVGLNNKLDKLTKGSEDYELIVKKIAIQEDRLIKIQEKRGVASTGITKKLAKQKDATGSTTAATMELSRVISDAPYGIRGMANNITQLVSQLGTAAKASGGLGGALKGMVKQMMGPLGVVFAITAVVSLIDYLYGANKKAESSTDDYTESLKGLEKALSSLYLAQDGVNKKFDEYSKLAKLRAETDALMKKEAAKLSKINKEISDQEKFNAIADERRFLGKEKRDKILSGLINKRNAVYKVTTDAINKLSKTEEDFNSAKEGTVRALELKKSKLIKYQKTISNTSEKWKEQAKKIKVVQDEIDAITGGDGKIVPKDRVDFLKMDSIGIGETDKKIKDSMINRLKAIAEAAGIDLKKDPLKIDTNLDLELSDEAKKMISDNLKREVADLVLSSQLDDFKDYADRSKEILSSITEFADAQFEREMTIESNKTNALNTELNNRLNNENLSKSQRASIQNEIAQNDEKLRVKQEVIEKKKFKMNKAANIAKALIDTASAAAGVMADAKGGFFARLSQAIPTIAFGLAQVATIARQKFQSSASKTPINTGGGGGGSGNGRAEPSFNIVGRSNDNLLINAIQAQFDKPLKAYVVSRDISNQQQLDGVIVNQAGI
tara:strand:+ start:3638 stop:5524 length:1887 start_codon:yes stop_codon:yes gene_type:complete